MVVAVVPVRQGLLWPWSSCECRAQALCLLLLTGTESDFCLTPVFPPFLFSGE